MRLLMVTNDGTVFRNGTCETESMFGGRVSEIISLKRALSPEHGISIKIISGEYGLIDGNDIISRYSRVTDSKIKYEELQDRTDFCGKLRTMIGSYDASMIFVPKEMMRLLIISGTLSGNVTAVTHPEFRDIFKERGWKFYERKGARIGKENMRMIIGTFSSCS